MSQPTPLQSLRAFETVDDPRRVHPTTLHQLMDIIAVTILGTLCGAENWVEIEVWAKSKESWLKTVLSLEHGIPSHDTISRVFSMLDPDQMVEALTRWTSALAGHVEGVVALDGKTVRRSMDTADGRRSDPHRQRVRREQPAGVVPGHGGAPVLHQQPAGQHRC